MRTVLVSLIWLLLLVLHAPTQAQAVVFSLLPDFLGFNASEPAMLLLTGAALIVLARIAASKPR